MKKLIALLLALAMLFCLAACGGDGEDKDTDKNEGKEAGGEEVVNLEKKYGIDLKAAGEQKMSEERASMDVLVETRDVWLEGKMTFAFDSEPKTYEDFVEHIGCDASYYINMEEDGERHFVWIAEGDETAKLLAAFWETPQGWTLYTIGSVNIG